MFVLFYQFVSLASAGDLRTVKLFITKETQYALSVQTPTQLGLWSHPPPPPPPPYTTRVRGLKGGEIKGSPSS